MVCVDAVTVLPATASVASAAPANVVRITELGSNGDMGRSQHVASKFAMFIRILNFNIRK